MAVLKALAFAADFSPLAIADLIPIDDWSYQRVALKDVNILFRYA